MDNNQEIKSSYNNSGRHSSMSMNSIIKHWAKLWPHKSTYKITTAKTQNSLTSTTQYPSVLHILNQLGNGFHQIFLQKSKYGTNVQDTTRITQLHRRRINNYIHPPTMLWVKYYFYTRKFLSTTRWIRYAPWITIHMITEIQESDMHLGSPSTLCHNINERQSQRFNIKSESWNAITEIQ
mgnify:CR=1 FL=1